MPALAYYASPRFLGSCPKYMSHLPNPHLLHTVTSPAIVAVLCYSSKLVELTLPSQRSQQEREEIFALNNSFLAGFRRALEQEHARAALL